MRKPSILILDEATSSLDAETERNVFRALGKLRCTRIVIAHRLSTIFEADQILVLDKNELVERGNHKELMALGGRYSRLIEAQNVGIAVHS